MIATARLYRRLFGTNGIARIEDRKSAASVPRCSKCPRGRGVVGGVTAERPRLDAGREMATEGGVVVADPVQSALDGLRHRGSGPLARGGSLTVASAESDRRRQLLADGVDLLAGA